MARLLLPQLLGPGVAARIVSEEPVDRVASRVITFVRPWLRGRGSGSGWGTDDGLVRREEMRTEGHLMDHTWTDFDRPVDIRPPR